MRIVHRLCAVQFEEVGRGEGQGYFACGAGGCGFESHLAHVEAGLQPGLHAPVAQR
jgi:hypothetical protein